MTSDKQFDFDERYNDPCDYYRDYYIRLSVYDIDKLDDVIDKLFEVKPLERYSFEKIYIRIQENDKSLEWIKNNKSKINECKDNLIEFIFGFDIEKYDNVFYNITKDCFTKVYDEYAGYGQCDDAATYYDVYEKEFTFNDADKICYEEMVHRLFKNK